MGAPEETDTGSGERGGEAAERLRGALFTGLDRLAFALEIEAAEAIDAGAEDAALRLEDQRLGVRLAQRLVAGVHADEVNLRIERTRAAYDVRTGSADSVAASS